MRIGPPACQLVLASVAMLDVRRMRVLVEVAHRGSLSAAADSLNCTPSAISQQVAALEREAGVALVERGPRSVTLTDAGRALVDHAEVILRRLEAAQTELRAIAGLKGGSLRLATFRTAGETLVADAINEFHARYPEVELALTEGEPEGYLPQLQAGAFDLALNFEYDHIPPPAADSMEQVLLLEEPMLVMLPQGHPAAAGPVIELAALANETWIVSSPRSSVHEFTARVCREAGFEPIVGFETDDYHFAQSLVARALGIAFLPAMSVRTLHAAIEVCSVAGRPPTRRVLAAYRVGGIRSPALRAMLDVLLQLAERFEPHDIRVADGSRFGDPNGNAPSAVELQLN